MSTPEWDFFKRLEKLEMTSSDIILLALVNFTVSFFDQAVKSHTPRKVKDDYLAVFKKWGMREELLEGFETYMLDVCERIEQRHTA